ncbi:MFS transporter [Micromonospora olivasterospora]|uniref:Putative MFS family arabinose efflux permease n=1 Tax=Micromonospora olivasterospora TaxID=1880 RepID=A0A562IK10_MICOL|nr:MFS transporter [Micromonospora olivasterospora]TWH70954.1 putative MFS family arabinose efflux permease [Micromonospora olivasterospora]
MTATLQAPTTAPELRRRHVAAVVACHFTAAFAALGLPPYLPQLLPALGDPHATWAGALYVVPTAATALSAPLWGRLADRYGRKRLLLRAQLGLAVAFLLTSQVQAVTALAATLALQGLLGGTFAATGAYLAAGLSGPRLAKALTAAQASARAALAVAPTAAGLLATHVDVRGMYAIAALGPLVAAGLTLALPEPRPATTTAAPADPLSGSGPAPSIRLLCVLEAAFVLATVVTFPYLLPVVQAAWPTAGPALAGALFALPHVCYLLAAPLVMPRLDPIRGLTAAFALVALGAAAHPAAVTWASPPLLVTGRLLLGAGLTCGLVALAKLTARAAAAHPPGRLFGTVEAWSKGGAVAAGLSASILAGLSGPAAPALFGAVIAALSVSFILRSSR